MARCLMFFITALASSGATEPACEAEESSLIQLRPPCWQYNGATCVQVVGSNGPCRVSFQDCYRQSPGAGCWEWNGASCVFVVGSEVSLCSESQRQCAESHPSSTSCWQYNGKTCVDVTGSNGACSSSFQECYAASPDAGCWEWNGAICVFVVGSEVSLCSESQRQCAESHPSSTSCWQYNGKTCVDVTGSNGPCSSSFQECYDASPDAGCWEWNGAICVFVVGSEVSLCSESETQCQKANLHLVR